MAKKSPNPTDRYVGSRIRLRRMMLNMSQEKLADGLSLTFQQVQKYEKGANRVGASRLQQIAQILSVPIPFFFEGSPTTFESAGPGAPPLVPDFAADFLSTRDGLNLAKAFTAIFDPKTRSRIVALVEQIAEG